MPPPRIHCITYQRLGFILEMRKRGYPVVWSDAVFALSVDMKKGPEK